MFFSGRLLLRCCKLLWGFQKMRLDTLRLLAVSVLVVTLTACGGVTSSNTGSVAENPASSSTPLSGGSDNNPGSSNEENPADDASTTPPGADELTESTKPEIVQSPSSQLVTEGEGFTLNVVAKGTGLQYQWYMDGQLLVGEASSQLVVTESTLSHSGSYSCVIFNGAGQETSSAAAVSVMAATRYGSVELSWSRPTLRTDNSTLPENQIQGYTVYYKMVGSADHQSVQVPADDLSVVVEYLEYGADYRFAVTTVDTDGLESELSDEFLLAIQ